VRPHIVTVLMYDVICITAEDSAGFNQCALCKLYFMHVLVLSLTANRDDNSRTIVTSFIYI